MNTSEGQTQEPVKPKPVKERDNLDLLELVCQLHTRACCTTNKEMHDAYVEARKEMESRLAEATGWKDIAESNANVIAEFAGALDYERKKNATPPPQPLGIDVEELINEFHEAYRKFEKDPDEDETQYNRGVREGKSITYANVVSRMRYLLSVSLPQSSTSEEEKDLWGTALNFFQGEYMLNPFTTKEEIISELLTTYKISKR